MNDEKSLPLIYEGRMVDGIFLSRSNRFAVTCLVNGLETRAFMPNPGRLGELLLPQARLILADHGTKTDRKTRYTVMAVSYRGRIVFLHTHLNNTVAEGLLDRDSVPALKGYRVVDREVSYHRNRFDFRIEGPVGSKILEVKSCTLAANGIAMFPDAVTERGRRHMETLAIICEKGGSAAILFVIHQEAVTHFLPDYHTDFSFSKAFCDIKGRLPIYAVSLAWSSNLRYAVSVPEVKIPWATVHRECVDRGYLLKIGQDGKKYSIALTPYTDGMSRTAVGPGAGVYPIRSSVDETEFILKRLAGCYGPPCADRVFRINHNPVPTGEFQELLLSFRMPPRLTESH
ncbi:MAG: DNA/RNA nuclease SfsA [Gemmatimonadota bacterium]|nr:DNA/RNA nuclease SfsA [Gemmatimonadota bacterium]